MLLRRSKLAAQRTERPYLAPYWLLLLMGGLIVVALILIYPEQNLIQRVVKAPESELSSAYVTNLLRTDPNNPKLRLLQATQALEHGNVGALREALEPMLVADDPAMRREVAWLLWQASKLEFNRLSVQGGSQVQAVRHQLQQQLAALAKEDWPTERQVEIAAQAFEFGEPAISLALYRQIAERSQTPDEAADWLAKGAGAALSHSLYRSSAELYLQASQKSSNSSQARALFLSALRTLQSGNRLAEALTMAEQNIGSLADDRETLFFVTRLAPRRFGGGGGHPGGHGERLARAAGRPDVADRYVRRLLRLSLLRQLEEVRLAAAHGGALPQKVSLRAGGPQLPFDDKAYTLGYEVFLENRKLEDAWKVASSAVRQSPDDMAWRERLAKVAEWTSRPEMALEHWWHLARETQRDDAWQPRPAQRPSPHRRPAIPARQTA